MLIGPSVTIRGWLFFQQTGVQGETNVSGGIMEFDDENDDEAGEWTRLERESCHATKTRRGFKSALDD